MPPFWRIYSLVHQRTLLAARRMKLLPLLCDHRIVDLAAKLFAKFGDPFRAEFARAVVLILACHFLTGFFERLAMHGVALIQTQDRIATLEGERLLDLIDDKVECATRKLVLVLK